MKVGGQKGWQDISVSCTSHGFRAGIKQRLMPAGSTGILPSGPQILAGASF